MGGFIIHYQKKKLRTDPYYSISSENIRIKIRRTKASSLKTVVFYVVRLFVCALIKNNHNINILKYYFSFVFVKMWKLIKYYILIVP